MELSNWNHWVGQKRQLSRLVIGTELPSWQRNWFRPTGDDWRMRLASDNLASTVMTVLEEVQQQTGFKVMVFLGGLAPNMGKITSQM